MYFSDTIRLIDTWSDSWKMWEACVFLGAGLSPRVPRSRNQSHAELILYSGETEAETATLQKYWCVMKYLQVCMSHIDWYLTPPPPPPTHLNPAPSPMIFIDEIKSLIYSMLQMLQNASQQSEIQYEIWIYWQGYIQSCYRSNLH